MFFSHKIRIYIYYVYIYTYLYPNFSRNQEIDMRWVFTCQGWGLFQKYRTPKSNHHIFFCGISLGDDYLEGSSHYKCWTLPYNSGSTIDIPIISNHEFWSFEVTCFLWEASRTFDKIWLPIMLKIAKTKQTSGIGAITGGCLYWGYKLIGATMYRFQLWFDTLRFC